MSYKYGPPSKVIFQEALANSMKNRQDYKVLRPNDNQYDWKDLAVVWVSSVSITLLTGLSGIGWLWPVIAFTGSAMVLALYGLVRPYIRI